MDMHYSWILKNCPSEGANRFSPRHISILLRQAARHPLCRWPQDSPTGTLGPPTPSWMPKWVSKNCTSPSPWKTLALQCHRLLTGVWTLQLVTYALKQPPEGVLGCLWAQPLGMRPKTKLSVHTKQYLGTLPKTKEAAYSGYLLSGSSSCRVGGFAI